MNDRKYYEAYDDRYRQVHEENLLWFSQEPSKILWDIMEKFAVGKKQRILELGCGEGRDASVLLKRGYSLLATDISEEAILFCRKRFGHEQQFQILDCVRGGLEDKFHFIYAISVLHMLVADEDRAAMLRFVHDHLEENGIALICSMGDGQMECCSDPSTAFALQERVHEATGRKLFLAGTSYRGVRFPVLEMELEDAGFKIVEEGITRIDPDYRNVMYAVVAKKV